MNNFGFWFSLESSLTRMKLTGSTIDSLVDNSLEFPYKRSIPEHENTENKKKVFDYLGVQSHIQTIWKLSSKHKSIFLRMSKWNLVPTGEMNIEQRLLNNKLSFKTAAASRCREMSKAQSGILRYIKEARRIGCPL